MPLENAAMDLIVKLPASQQYDSIPTQLPRPTPQVDSAHCPACGEEQETVKNFLLRCHGYVHQRWTLKRQLGHDLTLASLPAKNKGPKEQSMRDNTDGHTRTKKHWHPTKKYYHPPGNVGPHARKTDAHATSSRKEDTRKEQGKDLRIHVVLHRVLYPKVHTNRFHKKKL